MNKTPRANNAVTGLVHKKLIALVVFLVIAAIGITAALYTLRASGPAAVFDGKNVRLEVVRTSDARMRGLSGRHALDGGMLFIFDKTGKHCMWMKDMKFAIDIVWLDKNQHVVHVQKDAVPESYPENFCPDKPAKYVVELNAGSIEQLGIQPGQYAELRNL